MGAGKERMDVQEVEGRKKTFCYEKEQIYSLWQLEINMSRESFLNYERCYNKFPEEQGKIEIY